jgi:hypothetical protein
MSDGDGYLDDWLRNDGWITDTATWTYASATTFTIAGDVRAKFPKGTKIKLTNSTVKYFYVVGTAYSSPNTTVTVLGGSDYTLAAGAISATYYSYGSAPQDFPNRFYYTPTWTAATTNPVINSGELTGEFVIEGKNVAVTICMSAAANTTFGTGTWSFGLPVTVGTSPTATHQYLGSWYARDNSAATQYCGTSSVARGSTSISNMFINASATLITLSTPFTWAVNDRIEIFIMYRLT